MSKVRDYYDANTWKFLLSSAEGAIHRELWGPGTADRRDALHYVHRRMLDHALALRPSGEARIVDLGCGVGAGALYLAERIPAQLHGISISPRQVERARRRARRASLRGTCAFHEADFCALPDQVTRDVAGADLAYAVEAFVHAPSAAAFFGQAARLVRPGGRLALVDDFLAGDIDSTENTLLDDFRAGWQINTLLSGRAAAALAAQAGFELVEQTRLSPYMNLGRPRDRLIRAVQPLLRRGRRYSYWFQSLVGGDALQRCHQTGVLSYDELVFVRAPGAAHELGGG
jgi:SAM-dependent methyltransferase